MKIKKAEDVGGGTVRVESDDGEVQFVPSDSGNPHRIELEEWKSKGNSVAAERKPPTPKTLADVLIAKGIITAADLSS